MSQNNRMNERSPSGRAEPSSSLPPVQMIVAGRAADDATPVPEPAEFFRPHAHDATVAFAQEHASNTQRTSDVLAWLRAAQLELALWPLASVLIAGALVFALRQSPHLDRLTVIAVTAVFFAAGAHLLRGITHEDLADQPISATLLSSLRVRVGVGGIALGLIGGAFAAHWLAGSFIPVAIIGILAALGYTVIPAVFGPVPGDEIIPAVLLGPVLFLISLGSQLAPSHAHGKTVPVSALLTPATWALAGGLGFLFLAALIARQLRDPEPITGLATRALIGVAGMRLVYGVALLLAYGFVFTAGLRKDAPHAALAVLLTLPVAIIPFTGVIRAARPAALRVLLSQTQRVIVWFTGALVAAFLLSALYLHIVSTLRTLVGPR